MKKSAKQSATKSVKKSATFGPLGSSDGFLAFVCDQLSDLRNITTRRMFGAIGLYSGDVFFAVIGGDTLYLKTDAENVGDHLAAGGHRFDPYDDPKTRTKRAAAGDPTKPGYYSVPIGILEDADTVNRWARRAIDAAQRVKASPRKKASTPTRKKATATPRTRAKS